MQRSKSSKRWLQEHFADVYVKQAQKEGYRSRAIYKLKEIDDKEHLFKPGMTVVDLGAAPGGWTQYVSEKIGCTQGKEQHSRIIALDCLPMDALPGVEVILGDFTEDAVLHHLQTILSQHSVDVVLSDMAPNMSGNPEIDLPRAMYLAELALDFAYKMLKSDGCLVMKLFHGSGFDLLIKALRPRFKKVLIRKPQASRSRSRETYLLAKGYIL
jgi:23S rRNA (uridine2552-2'-O)-methyltransferase